MSENSLTARVDVALQLTLKYFEPQLTSFSPEEVKDGSANEKLAKSIAAFFNTVYDNLTDG